MLLQERDPFPGPEAGSCLTLEMNCQETNVLINKRLWEEHPGETVSETGELCSALPCSCSLGFSE